MEVSMVVKIEIHDIYWVSFAWWFSIHCNITNNSRKSYILDNVSYESQYQRIKKLKVLVIQIKIVY